MVSYGNAVKEILLKVHFDYVIYICICVEVVLLIEAIWTILSLFIIFFMKIFHKHKSTTQLEVYAHMKNCCLCCLVLAYFCFVS